MGTVLLGGVDGCRPTSPSSGAVVPNWVARCFPEDPPPEKGTVGVIANKELSCPIRFARFGFSRIYDFGATIFFICGRRPSFVSHCNFLR